MNWSLTATCEELSHVVPFHQCDFLRSVPDCMNNDSFVNYLEFLYCTPDEVDPGYTPVIQLSLFLILLFFLLGTTAGEFLCPNLVNISRAFKMSQSVAGITLLAFGNGAPDVVSTLAGISQNRSSLVIAELYGGAMYICTVVIGLLFVYNDFDVPTTLLRDVLFYLSASFWALMIFRRGYVQPMDALGFLLLHVLYLLCAIILPRLIARLKDSSFFKKSKLSTDDGYSSDERLDQFREDILHVMSPNNRNPRMQRRFSSSVSLHRHLENAICTLTTNADHEIQEKTSRNHRSRRNSICEANLRLPRCPSRVQFFVGGSGHFENTPLLASSSTRTLPTEYIYPKVYTEWQELVMRLWPIESPEWSEMSIGKKIYHLATYPLFIPLLISIPLVDEHHRRSNWNRPLNVFQCIVSPLVFLLLTRKWDIHLMDTPLYTYVAVGGCFMALLVLLTSCNNEPPKYHTVFSFVGFLVSLAWIYRLAIEVVSILKTFGIYFVISEEVLGVTVLTWGNYLGDLVTNLSVASQGYPQMALSACLSTSLVAILIGFGSAFSTRFLMSGEQIVEVASSDMLDVIYLSLLGSVFLLVIGTGLARFRSSRVLGSILVVYYFTFLIVIFSKEFGLIRLIQSFIVS